MRSAKRPGHQATTKEIIMNNVINPGCTEYWSVYSQAWVLSLLGIVPNRELAYWIKGNLAHCENLAGAYNAKRDAICDACGPWFE